MNDFESKIAELATLGFIAGEAFYMVDWNPDLGGLHPDYKEGLKDENGKKIEPECVGDIEHKVYLATDVLFEMQDNFNKCDFCFIRENEYIEILKKQYPGKKNEIGKSVTEPLTIWDYETLEEKKVTGKVEKIIFIHKKNKYLPKGFKAVFTKDVLLSQKDFPFQGNQWWGKLNITRFRDLFMVKNNKGQAFFDDVKAIASNYNNLTNMIVRNQHMVSHPKWFVQEGSVEKQQLNNDISIVTVKRGFKEPYLAQANPTPREVFQFREEMKEDLYQMSRVSKTGMGEPPAGVKAFVALQFMHDAENRGQNETVMNFNKVVRDIHFFNVAIAGEMYKKEDKRTIQVLGQKGQYTNMDFDPETLTKPFSVVIQNTSA
jgi:hypothetical protein